MASPLSSDRLGVVENLFYREESAVTCVSVVGLTKQVEGRSGTVKRNVLDDTRVQQ